METVTKNEKRDRLKSTVLFTCSGRSNTGKLTDIAASTLSFRKPNLFRAIPAQKGAECLEDARREGELIFVVDGCEEHCAKATQRRRNKATASAEAIAFPSTVFLIRNNFK